MNQGTETMSNTQFAFMKKSAVPTAQALQQSIDALGFALTLDPELDLFKPTSTSPCVLSGEPDIFLDLVSEAASNVVGGDDGLRKVAGDNDWCISMWWHGSMKDCACVLIVSSALATDFGAVISYGGEPADDVAELLEATREAIDEARSES